MNENETNYNETQGFAPINHHHTIGIIGLGYVGLPLAVAFGQKHPTIGFDINEKRVSELLKGHDRTKEVTAEELSASKELQVTASSEVLKNANFFIVTVPTPIDDSKRPDLTPLIKASTLLGKILKPGDIVVYESTVYPGATEEVCKPLLEQFSGLKHGRDFYLGYSPERINPGDKEHRVSDIIKVTAGCCPASAQAIDNIYKSIIRAGTHKASSIKVAEAAKVIENTQRDLNIALINELAMIFARLKIDTHEVLAAAGTKWNFLPFKPGLVGGHCIGVDPYYLTHKAQSIGYHPEIILAGRRINDNMAGYVAEQVIKLMLKRQLHVVNSNILILGLSFKEDCPDIRNTKVVDVIEELTSYHAKVTLFDPCVDPLEAKEEYGYDVLTDWTELKALAKAKPFDGLIFAVGHRQFLALPPEEFRGLLHDTGVIFDVKGKLPASLVDERL